MNQSGLKEPGFKNRRRFSKKAREPQNHYTKQCVFVQIDLRRTDTQAFKAA